MPENRRLLLQIACVGVVLCVVFPVGEMMFPAAAGAVGALPFTTFEAVVTATLGLGLFEVLFG